MSKKLIISIELMIVFLILSSSTAMANNGYLDVNTGTDTHKEITSMAAASSKPRVAPINFEYVEYQKNKTLDQTNHTKGKHKTGFIPSPVNLKNIKKMSTVSLNAPAYYDLRTMNKVTPVKDQGNSGCCWAFATLGSLESYSMPNQTWDYSENNMKNVLSCDAPEGFDFLDGGNEFMSTSYLTRWSGSVNESDDPYSDYSLYSPAELDVPVNKHIQNVSFLSSRNGALDNDEIKWAVQNYGAMYTSMYYDPTCDNSITNSYYYNGSVQSNHAVAIVGWDDNYDKNYFSTVPPGNGAFIVKNSWGTGYGENGYFYVSYYDSNIGKDNTVFTSEQTDNFENIYQYDPLGWTGSVGYSNPICWGANIFTAKSNETLKAVSFYATDTNCNYQIFIYTNPESGPISQAGPVLTQSGTTSTSGYITVPLSSGVKLNAGQRFSVVLKLTTSGVIYPIAMEEPISGYSSKATANSGESFISSNGNGWTDITVYFPNTNLCLKAFTDPVQVSPLIITKTANPINYSIAGQNITYTYNVTNSGNVSILGPITVIDNKTGEILISNNELAPGSSVIGTANYSITQADLTAGTVTNSAYARGTLNTQTVYSDVVTATVTVESNPVLTITKTANTATFNAVDQIITYNYTVTNSGNVPISGIAVIDNKTAVAINNGTLSPGSSVNGTGTYTVTQADLTAGSVTNSAYARGTFGNQTVTSAIVTTTVTAVQNPALTITESASPITYNAVGQKITYSFKVTNTGNVPVDNIVFNDNKSDISGNISIGTLAPGQNSTGTDVHTINNADITTKSVVNLAKSIGNFNGNIIYSNQITVTVNYKRK